MCLYTLFMFVLFCKNRYVIKISITVLIDCFLNISTHVDALVMLERAENGIKKRSLLGSQFRLRQVIGKKKYYYSCVGRESVSARHMKS